MNGQDLCLLDEDWSALTIVLLKNAIKVTFALRTVPREAYVLGLAGLIPYLTTSLTTVWCARELNVIAQTGGSTMLTEETALQVLNFLEPIQVGYGAVVRPTVHKPTYPHAITKNISDLTTQSHNLLDHIFPRRHPLGSRMGRLQRLQGLPPLRNRSNGAGTSLAHNPPAL